MLRSSRAWGDSAASRARSGCPATRSPPRCAIDKQGHNARLNYVVKSLTTGVTNHVNTHPINTRHGVGGGFFGDHTDIAVGSDGVFHALWTVSNEVQTVVWFYGLQFVPTPIHQQDVVTGTGNY